MEQPWLIWIMNILMIKSRNQKLWSRMIWIAINSNKLIKNQIKSWIKIACNSKLRWAKIMNYSKLEIIKRLNLTWMQYNRSLSTIVIQLLMMPTWKYMKMMISRTQQMRQRMTDINSFHLVSIYNMIHQAMASIKGREKS